jgi:hypothetical protein
MESEGDAYLDNVRDLYPPPSLRRTRAALLSVAKCARASAQKSDRRGGRAAFVSRHAKVARYFTEHEKSMPNRPFRRRLTGVLA